MSMNRTSGLALLFIVLGGLVLLNKMGLHFHVMGYLVPLAIAGLGYMGIRNGKKIGWFFAILGIVILAAKLSWLISILFAVLLIAFGVSMLKKRSNSGMYDL
jgi:lia operon protein LiaI